MTLDEAYEKFLLDVKNEFPDFVIKQKETSVLMKFIDAGLRIITLGKMKTFMTGFVTTIGAKVYVPQNWSNSTASSKLEVIRHELIHMRQARKYGRLWFSILYLFLPFPLVFSYYRKKFEQEAYEESLRALYEYHGQKAFTDKLKSGIVAHFTTSQYFWMWPWRKSVEKWYDDFISKLTNN